MNFPVFIYLVAFVSSWLIAWLSVPWWRQACIKAGLVDDPGPRKTQHEPVPLAGGAALLVAILLPVLLGALSLKSGLFRFESANLLVHGLNRRFSELLVLGGGAVGITLLGWLDDRHELGAVAKFTGQVAVALAVAMASKRITLFVHSELFSYTITVFWVLTVINAFNFMDNMNGLCGGVGAIGALWFAVIAACNGQYLVALTGFLMAGGLLGFLPHNFPLAHVYLGDAGSHLTGYLLAVMAILPHFYTRLNPHPWAVLSPLAVLGIPLLDIVQVSLYRISKGKPFWLGDHNHLSHRLVHAGFSPARAVALLWFLTALLGSLSLLFEQM